jgi:tetratricopeptide (TPR) repeat protein
MAEADRVMDLYPDSALRLLQGISPSDLEEGDRMRHRLLTVEAECRNGQMPASDSLLWPVIGYFHRAGDVFWEARGEYNRGCILYQNHRQAGQALDIFQRVKALMEQCGNTWWLGRTYGRMAYIYHSQGMLSQADSLYCKAEQICVQVGDTALWLETLDRRSIHLIAMGEEHYREAETQLLKACQLAQQKGLSKYQSSCMLTLSQLYSYMQDGEQSLRYAQEAFTLNADTTEMFVACLLVGEAHYKLNHYDSATVWLERTIACRPSLPVRSAAYMRLADIAEEQGNTEKALAYQKMYQQAEHEVNSQSQVTEIRLTEQSQVHRREQAQMKRLILICLAAIGVLAVCIVLLLGWRIRERKRRRRQMDTLMKYWWQEHWILLSAEPSAAEPEVRLLPPPAEREEQSAFNFDNLSACLQETEPYAKAKRILAHYKSYADYEEHFTVEDQDQLLHYIDLYTDGFITRLKKKASLSENDLRFCGLHLLGWSTQEIAVLLEKDRSGVYKRQKRILHHCFPEAGDEKLEKVLKSIK